MSRGKHQHGPAYAGLNTEKAWAGTEGGAPVASPPLQSDPDRATVRLELLRLAHRHDAAAENIVERARAFEAYVFGDQTADKP